MRITTIEQAELRLKKYVPNVAKFTGDNMSLERMWPLLELFGNPHEKVKTIHIAGTSGKTSTAYYISHLLTNNGKKTGLTVSPHVYSLTERVQIDSKPLQDIEFCNYLNSFLHKLEQTNLNPSYFELLVVFSLWVFEQENVDYAVVETGMGGLLDGTNVVTRADKICAITDIGFDHMHILGNTLSEIAVQKAGIIHKDNHVFMYEQSDEVMKSVYTRLEKTNANLHIVGLPTDDIKSYLPEFQKRNFNLAMKICNFVAKRDNFKIKDVSVSKIHIPGRMETRKLQDGSILIVDGAHNEQKIQAFVTSFTRRYGNQKTTVILSLKEGKEYKEVLQLLKPITDNMIITTFDTSQDLPARAQDPTEISNYCTELSINNTVIEDNKAATKAMLESKDSIKVIIGSFYLIGQVNRHIYPCSGSSM